jgi:hypothetical protein
MSRLSQTPGQRQRTKLFNQQKKKQQKKQQKKQTPLQKTEKQTKIYLKGIKETQKSEQSRFESLAKQQQKAFEQQFQAQGAQLNQRLSNLQKRSTTETQGYQSLIARITGQQEQELGRLRQQFDRQNQESEGVISRLQSDIERLSTPAAPPKIDVDTRPAVVGISGFQEASQRRQRLGTSGGRRSTKAAPTSAFGLQTAY